MAITCMLTFPRKSVGYSVKGTLSNMEKISCDSLKFWLILPLSNLFPCFFIFIKSHYLKYSDETEFMWSVTG